jgi:hypothetical protein
MEHIVAAWDMAGLAIVVHAIGPAVVAEVLVDHKIVALAIGPVAAAEALVGRKVENCP